MQEISSKQTDLVPSGAFSFPVDQLHDTRWFSFLLLPEFTLLAFSAAVDPLRIANQLAQKPLYGWRILSDDGAPVSSSTGIDVAVQASLDALSESDYLFVCSGNNGSKAANDAVLGKLRKHHRFGGKLGGICTGAATLARIGMLGGKDFTLHWENQPGFMEVFPDLTPSRHRFERDGDLLTCGGGVASTELMLSIIADDYGQDFALAVSDMCLNRPEVSQRSEQRSSIAKAINSRNPRILSILRLMYKNIEEPLTLEELAAQAQISRRQMERLFIQLMDEPPARVYRNIRLDRGRALLMETDLSVSEVAMAAGFNSNNIFTRHFKARFGESPYGHRGRS
ncbi:transcriptional regulator [Loktanella sp. 5RATIMAR09]|uniref:GlxA family transcriptional regulator n=1 Tax=Loktanella sp. 5RATIMAR09 TaxID=1225655 RepID=UPI0007073E02|nr:GlxA family transcriptional regulator [Loktanella sp. 5RATIMAR09]KQI72995.1 transcriptional regulator [Loktanella sp. 5RATIMAR09]